MVWNYHDDDVPAAGAPVRVTIAGIPSGVKKVLLQHYRIDDTHSNSYTVWKRIGSPQSPTAEQYAQLKDAGQLELLTSPEWLDVSNSGVRNVNVIPPVASTLTHAEW